MNKQARHFTALLAVACSSAGFACSQEPSSAYLAPSLVRRPIAEQGITPHGAYSRPLLSIQPLDFTTGIENLAVSMLLERFDPMSYRGQPPLEIAKKISVRTWPELAPVLVSYALREQSGRVEVALRIEETLDPEQWYAVEAPSKLDGVLWHPMDVALHKDELRYHRFRISSGVRISGLSVARKEGGAVIVNVDLSEPAVTAGTTVLLSGARCDQDPILGDDSRRTVRLVCPNGIGEIQEMAVEVKLDGATSASPERILRKSVPLGDGQPNGQDWVRYRASVE